MRKRARWSTERNNRDGELILRPAAPTRWAMAVASAGAVLAMAIPMFMIPGLVSRAAGGLLIAAATVLAVRAPRQMVRCAAGVVTVRGMLFTRHIAAQTITEVVPSVTSYPAIYWRTANGRHRRLQLTGFWSGNRALPGIREYHLHLLDRLAGWIDYHHQRDP
jgi:hypothetical protein